MNPPESMRVAVLLFSDIVGSVAIQDRVGTEAYADLLQRHHEIFQKAVVSEHGGKILNYTGDGFLAELPNATTAVKAALRFHYLLHVEKWGPEPLRARVAVHLGEVSELRDPVKGDVRHVGMAVNFTARMMHLGDGGQTLVSRAIWDDAHRNVRAHPPVADGETLPQLEWKAHGLYKFKGGDEPVEVYEVGAKGIAPLTRPPDSAKATRVVEAPSVPKREEDKRPIRQRVLRPTKSEKMVAIKAGLAAACVGMVLALARVFDAASYDFAYLFQAPATPDEVVLIEMDSASTIALAPTKWDRRRHAELLTNLTVAGAKAVGFDITFASASDPQEDAALAAALKHNGKTVLGAAVESTTIGASQVENVLAPNEDLFRPVSAWGIVERAPKGQRIIRQPYAVIDARRPMFVEELARIALGTNSPTVPKGAWLKYYGPPGIIDRRSYLSVLSNQVPSAVFSNRVVIVGENIAINYAGKPGIDYFDSPYSRWRPQGVPGVEVNATCYANLVRGEWLWRLPGVIELGIITILALIMGWLCATLPRSAAVKITLGIGLLLAIALPAQVWVTGKWFPWLVLVIGVLPTALAVGVLKRK